MKPPVIPSVRTLDDARRALENLRAYLSGAPFIQQGDEATFKTVSTDGGTTKWKLGRAKTGASGLALVTTQYIEVTIGDKSVKLAMVE